MPAVRPAAGDSLRGSSPRQPHPLSRGRRIPVWTLVVLATVLALVSILTTWVNRQMLDNTRLEQGDDPGRPGPAGSVGDRHVHGQRAVRQRRRGQGVRGPAASQHLKPLAAPLAGALEQPLTAGVKRLLAAAARAAALHQRQHDRPPEARQRAREQDQATASRRATAWSRSTCTSCSSRSAPSSVSRPMPWRSCRPTSARSR